MLGRRRGCVVFNADARPLVAAALGSKQFRFSLERVAAQALNQGRLSNSTCPKEKSENECTIRNRTTHAPMAHAPPHNVEGDRTIAENVDLRSRRGPVRGQHLPEVLDQRLRRGRRGGDERWIGRGRAGSGRRQDLEVGGHVRRLPVLLDVQLGQTEQKADRLGQPAQLVLAQVQFLQVVQRACSTEAR